MTVVQAPSLSSLYELDETAWLDAMSALAASGQYADLDYQHLSEYLADMAKRDRREVVSRLIPLLIHLLKWQQQTDRRSASWRGTIREQRRELRLLLESGTLLRHADSVLAKAYAEGREQAAVETELPLAVFPIENPWSLDELLAESLPEQRDETEQPGS